MLSTLKIKVVEMEILIYFENIPKNLQKSLEIYLANILLFWENYMVVYYDRKLLCASKNSAKIACKFKS